MKPESISMSKIVLIIIAFTFSSCMGQDLELTYSEELTIEDVPRHALEWKPKERFTSYWKNGESYVFDRSVSRILHKDLQAKIISKCKDRKTIKYYLEMCSNDKWGLFDFELHEILPFNYDNILAFREWNVIDGKDFLYTVVQENKLKGLMNESFKYFIQPNYQYLSQPKGNCLIAKRDGKFGLIDRFENVLVPFDFDTIESTIKRNVFLVKLDSKYGTVTNHGEIRISIEWEYLKIITSYDIIGYDKYKYVACYGKAGKYGLLSDKGIMTDLISEVPIQYTNCRSYCDERLENLYIIQTKGKQGVINDIGEVVFNTEYDKIEEINFDKTAESYNKKTNLVYNQNHGLGKHPRIYSISDIPRVHQVSDEIEIDLRLGLSDLSLKKGMQIDTVNVYSSSTQEIIFIPITLLKVNIE